MSDFFRPCRQLDPFAQACLIIAIALLLQSSLNGLAYFNLFPDLAGKSLNGAAKNSTYLINGSLSLLACWYFEGRQGVWRIIQPYGRILVHPLWWLLAFGIMVPVLFAALHLSDWLLGQPFRLYAMQLPSWNNVVENTPLFVQVAVSDELFWIGFIYPRLLQAGISPLKAALVIGVFWGMQYLPFIFTGFFIAPGMTAANLVLGWFAITPIYVWLYHKTGSALLLVVFNVSMQFAFSAVPILPQATGDNSALAMASLVTLLFGLALWWRWPGHSKSERALAEPVPSAGLCCQTASPGSQAKCELEVPG